MKFAIVAVIALVAFVAAEEEWKPITDVEVFRQIHEDCSRECGLTTRQIEAILNKERPDEDEVHAYVLCEMKAIGVFSEDKGYNLDRVMAQFNTSFHDAERVRHMVANCIDSNEEQSPVAVWAYRGQKCMLQSKLDELLRSGKSHK